MHCCSTRTPHFAHRFTSISSLLHPCFTTLGLLVVVLLFSSLSLSTHIHRRFRYCSASVVYLLFNCVTHLVLCQPSAWQHLAAYTFTLFFVPFMVRGCAGFPGSTFRPAFLLVCLDKTKRWRLCDIACVLHGSLIVISRTLSGSGLYRSQKNSGVQDQ